ncbi:uncharacterized protein [Montipora foliosa]|uniref:uncharacterized protein n=1 Tax=Montipora foliosa TaxID=591990 RepID=UPI0035F1307F
MGISDVQNPRLQRLMMRIMPYSLTAQWVKRKDYLAEDAWRFPVDQPSLDDELCEAYTEATGHIHFAAKFINDLQLSEISKENIRCGWPDSPQEVAIEALAKPFWSTLHQLYLVTPTPGCSLLLVNGRTVIPSSLQKKILLTLHEGNQGIDKTRRSARDSVFWPGIDRDIENMVKRCHQCLLLLPANCKEPLQQPPLPTRPWDKLGLDLCILNGHENLIITNSLSLCTEVRDLK